ncbi:MAG: DMT family transporter [Schleiferiaceae bacterium]|nr:DMT family transporter [Schleiferiaceae bacterium]
MKSKYTSVLVFVALALTWGSSFILMKKGLTSFSAFQIGALRIITAFIFTIFIAAKHFKAIKRVDFKPLLIVGWLGNGIPYFFFPLSVSKIDSSIVGIINAMVPLFTMIIGVVLFRSPVKIWQVFGVLLGLGGAVYLLAPGATAVPTAHAGYAGFAISATLMYAISINTIKNKLAHLTSLQITLLALLYAAIPSVVYLLFTDFFYIMKTDPNAWVSLGYISILGVVGSSLAILLFNFLIKSSTPIFSASVTYFIPIVAIGSGWVDGESVGWGHLIGILLILSGVYLVNYRRGAHTGK